MNIKETNPIIRGIYLFISPTNKHYIGQSKDCLHRLKAYHKPSCKSQKAIYDSLVKYGFNQHQYEIIHVLNDDEDLSMLNIYEKYYIRFYRECGKTMLNLTDGGDGVELTAEVRLRIRDTNRYFRFEILNKITGDIEFTTNIEMFCQNNGNIDSKNLNSTLYGLNNKGYSCYKNFNFQILSKIQTRDSKINDDTQTYIINERIRRQTLQDNRDKLCTKYITEDVYTQQNIYVYRILNIKTNDLKYYANLTQFCKLNNISDLKSIISTLYGYDKYGNKKLHANNFKIVEKHILRFDIKKENRLQEKIIAERNYRLNQRSIRYIVDRHSDDMKKKRMKQSEQYSFKILHIPSNEILQTNNLSQFCLKYLNKKSQSTLSNSLYGYSYSGHNIPKDGDYKIISKHHIDSNLDNNKLQEEINTERTRRSQLRQK